MAEFIDVIYTIQRICKKNNGQCSACMLGEFACPNNARFDKTEEAAFCELEDAVVKWAEENPEPAYPTWGEWFAEQGELSANWKDLRIVSCSGKSSGGIIGLFYNEIPADIAQKLGIEPLPVVHCDCGATNEADARKKLVIEPRKG